MSARLALLAALALTACAPERRGAIRIPIDFPPTPQQLAAGCEGKDGWNDPAAPARIFGNVYYVGTCGITSLLIAEGDWLVLIDGGTAEAAPQIVQNIGRVGFRAQDVRYILSSHEHADHVGGLAELKRLMPAAQLIARAEARPVLQSGRVDQADPQAGTIPGFEGARVDRVIRDGETLRVGRFRITAHATPGHTSGSTSWTWRSCWDGVCRNMVYADSLTAVGPESYRFSDHPELVARFRSTFERVAALPCDLLITPHPGASSLFPRLAGRAPLADPTACRSYAEAARQRLDGRLAQERAR